MTGLEVFGEFLFKKLFLKVVIILKRNEQPKGN